MERKSWICACGTENTNSVCTNCGNSRPEASDDLNVEYLKLQIKREEMLQEQEEKKIARQAEKEKRQREYDVKLNEYNEKCKEIPIRVLKSWSSSWIVLVLSILASVSAVCSLISLFTTLSSGWFKIIVSVVKLLLNCLVCAGFWQSYVMGKRKDMVLNNGGARMLHGVLKFYQAIMYLIMVLIIGLFILVFATMKSCADKATDGAGAIDSDLGTVASGVNSALTGILVGMLIALIVVFVVLIIYFTKTTGFAKTVIQFMQNNMVSISSYTSVAILLFIVGGFTLIGAIGTVAATSLIGQIFGQMGDIGDKLGQLRLFEKADIADMLAQISKAGMYIFGGVLALQFQNLANKVLEQKKLLEKPVL